MNDAALIILTGSFVALACSLLGTFLVLRKMSMVADAISHAVLPGLVVAYLVSGSRASFPMLIGAAAFGMITTVLIELFQKRFKLQMDASIGVTYTALFAIGVIMISSLTGKIDLDQDCVLYGEIAYVPLDLWITPNGINMGPYTTWIIGIAALLVLAFVLIGYKGLKVTTFDENYAISLGIATSFWQYALMSMVSLTTVVSFEAVGAILVVAFFIIPPATAYLWTDKLKRMLWLSCFFGILSAGLGYSLAVWINGSIAGAMATVAGFFFMISFLFNPHSGILVRRKVIIPFSEEVDPLAVNQDALKKEYS